jgi:phosphohistidine phosphatase
VTHRLLVVRHAAAAPAAPHDSDHDRVLDAKGRGSLPWLARRIDAVAAPVGLVVASTAARVRETVAGMAVTAPIAWSKDLYLADVEVLFEILRELDDRHDRVVLCGHNPGVHQLVLDLDAEEPGAALEKGFPTAAVAAFDLDVDWRDLEPGVGRLVEFSWPKRDR